MKQRRKSIGMRECFEGTPDEFPGKGDEEKKQSLEPSKKNREGGLRL